MDVRYDVEYVYQYLGNHASGGVYKTRVSMGLFVMLRGTMANKRDSVLEAA